MKKYLFLLTILLVHLGSSGQTEFAKEYLPIWISAKNLTIELAEAMPDSLYDYRPTGEMRTFKQQMLHIGHTIPWMYQYLIEGKRVGLPSQPKAETLNKSQVIEYLKEQFDHGTELLTALTVKDLKRSVQYFSGGDIPLKYAFISIQDHLVNHRSKANLYFRLNGLKPPEYTYYKLE